MNLLHVPLEEINHILEYEFISAIGRGGQASVYHCKHIVTKKDYCMKHILIDIRYRSLKHYTTELDALSYFKGHPFIIELQHYFFYRSNIYIVMEYSKYGDLLFLLRYLNLHNKFLSEKQILKYFIQLCLAIHSLHNGGFVHRDIKLKNILLFEGDIVKIADFGTSIPLSTRSNKLDFIGTPKYMSPEMCLDQVHNFKTDIWSLGVVLYELMTRSHCFEGRDNDEIRNNIIKKNYKPILGERYSKELVNLLDSILIYIPNDRPNTNDILNMKIIKDYLKTDSSLSAIVDKYHIVKQKYKVTETKEQFLKNIDEIRNESFYLNEDIYSTVSTIERLDNGRLDLNSIQIYSKNDNYINNSKELELIEKMITKMDNIKMIRCDLDDEVLRKLGVDISEYNSNSIAFELELVRSRFEQIPEHLQKNYNKIIQFLKHTQYDYLSENNL